MIAYLKGTVQSKGKDSVVVVIDNFGYADALHGITGETVEEKIKSALKILGKR